MGQPNELIPDANILFSFFKNSSVRRHIIRELLKHDCKLICPVYVFEELLSDKYKIMKFSAIDEFEFSYLFKLLDKEIDKISEKEYKGFLSEAIKISPHKKDTPYFAVALSYKLPIWSDEEAFKQQSKIKIYTTKELLGLLDKEEKDGSKVENE